MSRTAVTGRTIVTGRATVSGRPARVAPEGPVDPLPGIVDFAFTANIPSDNGLIIANEMMGIEAGMGQTSDLSLVATLGTVNAGAKTFTLSTTWAGGVEGNQYCHFDSSGNWVGVLQLTSLGTPNGYTVVSGNDPVSNGLIYNHDNDLSVVRTKFSWREIEATKDSYAFAAVERSSGIKLVREMNAHNWGVKKYFMIWMNTDYPSNVAHRDIPDWLYTETGGDGVAYDTDTYMKGYSPDYSDATFIAAHGRLLAAMGTQWASDPALAGIMMGSIGHWGEVWTLSAVRATVPFPTNATVESYLDHYTNAFGNWRCYTRRSIASIGTRGWGLFNHGFYDAGSVYNYDTGGIHGLLYSSTDDYGNAQAAITDYKSRWKSGEPIGGTTSYAFADEPTSLITLAQLNDPAEWEAGKFDTTTGVAISNVTNAKSFRQKTRKACAPSTGYLVRHQPGWPGDMVGYKTYVYVTNSSDVLLAVVDVSDDEVFTTGSTAAYIRLSMEQYRTSQQDMTHAMVMDNFPRIYVNTGLYDTERNIELVMKQLSDYNMSAFSTKTYLWRGSAVATEANTKRFFNRLGYRIRPVSAALAGDALTVTLRNDGNQTMLRLPDRRIKVGLFSGTTLVWSGEGVENITDIPSDGTTEDVIALAYTTPGNYTLAVGVGAPSEAPSVNMPHSALTGHWYTIGTFVITQL